MKTLYKVAFLITGGPNYSMLEKFSGNYGF